MIKKIQGLLIQNKMQFLVTTVYCAFEFALKHFVEGDRGRETGSKGGGRCMGGGEEGVGSGIPKVLGSGGKMMQHCAIFCNRKMQKRGGQQIQGGNCIKGTGRGRFKPPFPPILLQVYFNP